jgi:hypothetical protein
MRWMTIFGGGENGDGGDRGDDGVNAGIFFPRLEWLDFWVRL